MTTSGDRITDRSLADIGGKGLFVKEIEEALIGGRAHFAVHSLKDVPPYVPEGLCLSCIPVREDARDVLVARSGLTLAELPTGSAIGTSSLRRRVQLLEARADLNIVPLRGNVDTRLRKCMDGVVDAIVLARAGLVRLAMSDRVTEVLSAEVSLPAPGQGALAIEQRADDARTRQILAPLHDASTAVAVAAERAVTEAAGADCHTPLAAYACRDADLLWVRALLATSGTIRRSELKVPWPLTEADAREAGSAVAERLLAE